MASDCTQKVPLNAIDHLGRTHTQIDPFDGKAEAAPLETTTCEEVPDLSEHCINVARRCAEKT